MSDERSVNVHTLYLFFLAVVEPVVATMEVAETAGMYTCVFYTCGHFALFSVIHEWLS